MNIKYFIRQILLSCLIVAFLTVQSEMILAADKIAGNLTVTGQVKDGVKPTVNVNNEVAVSGRSIFSTSVIETFENSGAVISIGKIGKIEAAENTKFAISFDAENVSCDLIAGSLTVVNSDHSFEVKLPDGKIIQLNAGETVNAAKNSLPAKSAAPSSGTGGGAAWLPWALIVGGAAAALVIATATGGNDIQLSGSTIVVSPTR